LIIECGNHKKAMNLFNAGCEEMCRKDILTPIAKAEVGPICSANFHQNSILWPDMGGVCNQNPNFIT